MADDVVAFVVGTVRGVILTLILIGLIRDRELILFARALIVLAAVLTAFVVLDALVSGPVMIDLGFVCGSALVLLVRQILRRRRAPSL